MSHEQSITIGMDDKFYNIPTVYQGKKLTDDQAVELFKQGKMKDLGSYGSQDEAVKAAQQRSQSFDHQPLQNNLDSVIQFLKGLFGL